MQHSARRKLLSIACRSTIAFRRMHTLALFIFILSTVRSSLAAHDCCSG